MDQFQFRSVSLEDTRRLGAALGRVARPGLVVGLIGRLGAGKTHFVRAVAEGLGVEDPRLVTSPTFVLIQEYAARIPIYHFDAYRLRDSAQFAELGAHEYFDGDGVCLVEWADRVSELMPADRLDVRFEATDMTVRIVQCRCKGRKQLDLLRKWSEALVGSSETGQPAG